MKTLTPEQRRVAAQKGKETRRRNIALRKEKQAQLELERNSVYQELVALKAQLNALKTESLLYSEVASLSSETFLREHEIVQSAKQYEISGIYFLVKDKKVVYVGQSVSVLRRIGTHVYKEFDSFAFVPCDQSLLDRLESLYIHLLRPPLNGEYASGTKISPIPLSKVFQGIVQDNPDR